MGIFLGKVIALVSDAFEDRTDKGGVPYVMHCFEVMQRTKARGVKDIGTLAAAFAHDLYEDRPERFKEFRAICKEYDYNYVPGYVLALSKGIDEPYEEFIESIIRSGMPEVMTIKMADLEHNSDINRLKGVTEKDLQRMKLYHESYLKLDRALDLLK